MAAKHSMKKIRRALWAIDPFEQGITLDPATMKDLGSWAKANKIEIEPVYLFTPVSDREILAKEKIQDKITIFFENRGIEIRQPSVLINRSFSLAKGIDQLLKHAEKVGAGLIIVTSHGRRNIPRMLFGSFAETLLNLSPVPLLFMNQHRRPLGASFRKALWATDFSKSCKRAFDNFVEQSKPISEELVIFNDAGLPREVRIYFHLEIGQPTLNEYLEQQERHAREEAKKWASNARKHGLRCISSVDQGYGTLSESIRSAARDNKAVIVMSSDRGPFEAVFLGSQAREIFRASEIPVWVYGPHFGATGKLKTASKFEPRRASMPIPIH